MQHKSANLGWKTQAIPTNSSFEQGNPHYFSIRKNYVLHLLAYIIQMFILSKLGWQGYEIRDFFIEILLNWLLSSLNTSIKGLELSGVIDLR